MLENLSKGFDVVSTRKISRHGETYCKRKTASLFYQLMRSTVDERLPPEVGDFRMFSRGAVIAIKQFREQHRFMRGLVAWLGLNECILPFERPARIAGETKYSSIKLAKLAWTAISSFTALPLKLPLYAGVLLLVSGVLFSVYTCVAGLLTQQSFSAWSWLVGLQLVVHGITLAAVGLLGDYVGRIYDEAKERPLYVIADGRNITPDSPHARTVWIPPMESTIPTRQLMEMEQPARQAERWAA
jgi:dolichol-phosphate mannosyltransferase